MPVMALVQKGLVATLKVFVAPIVTAVPSAPGVRRLSAYAARRGPFAIPWGKTLVLVPLRTKVDDRKTVAENDNNSAREIGAMMSALGFREDKDWHFRSIDEPLSEADSQENLVVICGTNPMFHEILKLDPRILRSISLDAGASREHRRFIFSGHEFVWNDSRDFALLAVKPNPYNGAKRLVLILGLTDMGTRGAAQAFARPGAAVRSEIESLATRRGDVEVLLRVEYPASRREVSHVDIAKLEDGEPLANEKRAMPIHQDTNALNRVYVSLKQNPRAVRWSNIVSEVTYTRDFGVRFKREWTWQWAGQDILVQGIDYGADEDLPLVEQLDFMVRAIQESDGDIVSLVATNSVRRKAFLLFPIPPIVENDPPRTYAAVASWPRAAKLLKVVGGEDDNVYRTPPYASGNIDRVTTRFVFDIVDAKFSVTPLFPGVPSSATVGTFSIERPFVYEALNVSPDKELKFVIKRLE